MKNSPSFSAYIKSPYKSIKHNTYFNVYDHLFSKYRNKKIVFIEIGVLAGGSLFMWRNFFGSKARIIGIDMNPKAKKWERYGFEIFIGSQSDMNFWKNFCNKIGKIDIVLDDGGHTYDQQIITTEMLLENIKDGGLLVVEDTHTSYMKGFGEAKYSFINYTKNMIDRINKRFGKLSNNKNETRVWSIEIYESIVVFCINKKKANQTSVPTDNGGKDDKSTDYRYKDNKTIKNLDYINKFLKYIPGFKFIITQIKFFVVKINCKSKIFFK
jgi:cephalosporin hydroxylase